MSSHRPKFLYLQFGNPAAYPPVVHSSRLVAEAGYSVLVLGIKPEATGAISFPDGHPAQVRWLLPRQRRLSHKLLYLLYLWWSLVWLLRFRPQWLYVSDMMATPVGVLGSWLGLSVIYHEHDSPFDMERASRFMRSLLYFRSRMAKRAEIVILPNERRARAFKQETGIEPIVVWNCPDRIDAMAGLQPEPSSPLRLIYHGTIVPARLPVTVIDAIASLRGSVTLTIIGYDTIGSPNYSKQLLQRAQSLGIAEYVKYLGTVGTREELLNINRQCHVGLSLVPSDSESQDGNALCGASNKVFEYMACGTAVIVTDLPEWEYYYRDGGYGITCKPESVNSLIEAFEWLVHHPDERKQMGEKGRQQILDTWNYQHQFAPILQAIKGGADEPLRLPS